MDLKWDPLCKHCGQRKGDHSALAGYPCSSHTPGVLFLDSGQNRTDQGLVYDPKGLPAHPAVMPSWRMPVVAPLGPWSSPTFLPSLPIPWRISEPVMRNDFNTSIVPPWTKGFVTKLDHTSKMVTIGWESGGEWDYSVEGLHELVIRGHGAAPATTKAVVNPAKCDTCSNPNAFNAAANQPNGAFRCGQCRAMRQVFG